MRILRIISPLTHSPGASALIAVGAAVGSGAGVAVGSRAAVGSNVGVTGSGVAVTTTTRVSTRTTSRVTSCTTTRVTSVGACAAGWTPHAASAIIVTVIQKCWRSTVSPFYPEAVTHRSIPQISFTNAYKFFDMPHSGRPGTTSWFRCSQRYHL